MNKTNVRKVTLPNSITTIKNHAFDGCTGLESVTIDNKGSSVLIEAYAFQNCSSLGSFTSPRGISSIGDYAFQGCSSLLQVPDLTNVSSIGREAFSGCTSLTSFQLPESITRLESGTFSGCTGLTSVILHSRLNYLGGNVFNGCSLSQLTLNIPTPPTITANTFANLPANFRIVMPCELYGTYISQPYWSDLTYSPYGCWGVVITSEDNAKGMVSELTPRTPASTETQIVATPATGYLFDHWSDGNTDNPRTLTIDRDIELQALFGTDPEHPAAPDSGMRLTIRLNNNQSCEIPTKDIESVKFYGATE